MTGVFIKREIWAQRHTQGERHVKIKAEIRVMQQKPRNIRLPANHQKLGERHGTDSQPSEGTNVTDTLISDFQPSEL